MSKFYSDLPHTGCHYLSNSTICWRKTRESGRRNEIYKFGAYLHKYWSNSLCRQELEILSARYGFGCHRPQERFIVPGYVWGKLNVFPGVCCWIQSHALHKKWVCPFWTNIPRLAKLRHDCQTRPVGPACTTLALKGKMQFQTTLAKFQSAWKRKSKSWRRLWPDNSLIPPCDREADKWLNSARVHTDVSHPIQNPQFNLISLERGSESGAFSLNWLCPRWF